MAKSIVHPMVSTYILAGGRSSRFGSDKARELIDGTPQIVNLHRMFSEQSQSRSFIVAGAENAYADLKLPTIADATPNLGPVSGVVTALEHLTTCIEKQRMNSTPLGAESATVGDHFLKGEYLADWCLIVACDMWEWHAAWATKLLEAAASTTSTLRADCRAICFFESHTGGDNSRNGRWTPFPGLFHSSAAEYAKQIRDSAHASMQELLNLKEMNTRSISLKGVPEIRSANTRKDFDNWKKHNSN